MVHRVPRPETDMAGRRGDSTSYGYYMCLITGERGAGRYAQRRQAMSLPSDIRPLTLGIPVDPEARPP